MGVLRSPGGESVSTVVSFAAVRGRPWQSNGHRNRWSCALPDQSERVVADLAGEDIEPQGPIETEAGKAAWFKDSEGNIMCIDDGAPPS